MSSWTLIQIFLNLIFLSSTVILWLKIHRPTKEDPRLSKGLQLLQSKISILEDLSDRTETQVQQLTGLMDQKAKQLQEVFLESEKQLHKITESQTKSLEVAQIFQDRIPHQEIAERQKTMKYVKAARLAHQGYSMEEILSQVDLSRAEVELIAKVNKDQLQFSEEDLPAWAKQELPANPDDFVSEPLMKSQLRRNIQVEKTLSEVGEKFRQSMKNENFVDHQSGIMGQSLAGHSHAEPQNLERINNDTKKNESIAKDGSASRRIDNQSTMGNVKPVLVSKKEEISKPALHLVRHGGFENKEVVIKKAIFPKIET